MTEANGDVDAMSDLQQVDTQADACESAAAQQPPATREEFLRRAMAGDTSVLPLLQQHLDANSAIWSELGDLGATATNAWITLIAGPNLVQRESLVRKVVAMQLELLRDDAPPIERLLAQRVVAEWIQIQYADNMVAQTAGHPPRILEFWGRRQAETQRRYLAAIKALSDLSRIRLKTSLPGSPQTTAAPAKRLSPNAPMAKMVENAPEREITSTARPRFTVVSTPAKTTDKEADLRAG